MSTIHDYVTVTQAAKIVGVTPGRIRQMLANGAMHGEKFDGRMWVVPVSEAERLRDTTTTVGRPRGCREK